MYYGFYLIYIVIYFMIFVLFFCFWNLHYVGRIQTRQTSFSAFPEESHDPLCPMQNIRTEVFRYEQQYFSQH